MSSPHLSVAPTDIPSLSWYGAFSWTLWFAAI